MTFGETIRKHRKAKGLFLRQAAAYLEVDTAFVSKLERGEKRASKEQVQKLSKFLDTPEDKLMELWLADRVMNALEGEPHSEEAMKLVTKRIKNSNKK